MAAVTNSRVAFVDLYPVRLAVGGLEALTLRRAAPVRCAGAWEAVHGSIEAGELPAGAALRELREETGLAPERLYNLSRVESFYQHPSDELIFIPVFVAVVGHAPVTLSREHDAFEWLPITVARERLAWPRERRALEDIIVLLPNGEAGALEDVLRIEE